MRRERPEQVGKHVAREKTAGRFGRLPMFLMAGTLLVYGFGCGPKVALKERSAGEDHIGKVIPIVNAYRSAGKGMPSSADQIKKWAADPKVKAELKKDGIEDIEKALISPRDNQPYGFISYVMGMGPIIAYEQTGSGGKHLVVGGGGQVRELPEAEFQKELETAKSIGPPSGKMPGRKGGSGDGN